MNRTFKLTSGIEIIADICDDCDEFGGELLARLTGSALQLKEGESTVAELDWATVALRYAGRYIFVDEPDYTCDGSQFVESLRVTSQIFLWQRQLLQSLGAMPQPVGAQDYVRASDDALQAVSVIGHRLAEADSILTGWQVVSTSPDENAAFGMYTVREFAVKHVRWCVPFVLPPKWSFRFVGATLLSCESPSGVNHTVTMSLDL